MRLSAHAPSRSRHTAAAAAARARAEEREKRETIMTRRDVDVDDIRVPIGDSGEHVSIDPHNLPQKVEDVLGVLQSELAPLHAWLECAKAYLAEDNEEAFLEIVGSGCSPGKRLLSIVVSLFLLLFSLCPRSRSVRAFLIKSKTPAFSSLSDRIFSSKSKSADVNSLSLSLDQKPRVYHAHENRD